MVFLHKNVKDSKGIKALRSSKIPVLAKVPLDEICCNSAIHAVSGARRWDVALELLYKALAIWMDGWMDGRVKWFLNK